MTEREEGERRKTPRAHTSTHAYLEDINELVVRAIVQLTRLLCPNVGPRPALDHEVLDVEADAVRNLWIDKTDEVNEKMEKQ